MTVRQEPPLVLISLDRRTKMCGMLREGIRYVASVHGGPYERVGQAG